MSDIDNAGIELLYREYVRLHELADSYTKSSFEDFKLLAAIGALLALPPVAVLSDKIMGPNLLFAGFVAIMLLVAIIAMRDLMKQAMMLYYMDQVGQSEKALRVHFPSSTAFHLSESWDRWRDARYIPIARGFWSLFTAVVLAGPVAALCWANSPGHALAYLVIALLVVGLYLWTWLLLDPNRGKKP